MVRPELRLLAIAGPPVLDSARVVDACLAAAAGGATAVQLRVKDAPAAQLLRLAEQLCRALTIPVYVNDRADVALVAGAHGVHVGAEDLTPAAIRDFAGDALRIGISVGSREEAMEAQGHAVDYWSIGALYRTGTKADAGAPIGTSGFRSLAVFAPRDMTVIAIGGITRLNAGDVMAAGAHGVAVSHAVFSASNVEQAAREMRRVIDDALAGR